MEDIIFDGNQGVAVAAGGILNIIGDGVNTQSLCKGNTVLITLGDSPAVYSMNLKKLSLPKTNPSGAEGVIEINGKPFLHTFNAGVESIYIGTNSGNTINPSNFNIVIGSNSLSQSTNSHFNTALGSLQELVTGSYNTSVGASSLTHLKTGNGNVTIGMGVATNLSSGSHNILIGTNCAANYSSAESNNIVLGNAVAQADESNVVRIGNDGYAPGVPLSEKVYIYGIKNAPIESPLPVYIDANTHQLGTQSSSKTQKTNVKELSSASQALYAMKPISFNYKNSTENHFGFLAEDLAKVASDLVVKNQYVKMIEIIPMLVNEIQNLKKDLDALKDLAVRVKKLEQA